MIVGSALRNAALALFGSGLVRAIEIIYALGTLGALGALPSLLNVAVTYARRALFQLRRTH